MCAIDSAVDANGKNLVVKPILKHWKHDRESIQFFRASANFVYTFYSEGKRYFLRFANNSERTREAIYARLVRAMDLPDHPENPEWVKSLCLKLKNWINAYQASLES
jgi:hypothetical protein